MINIQFTGEPPSANTFISDHSSQLPKFCLSNYYSWNSTNATTSRDLTVTSLGADDRQQTLG